MIIQSRDTDNGSKPDVIAIVSMQSQSKGKISAMPEAAVNPIKEGAPSQSPELDSRKPVKLRLSGAEWQRRLTPQQFSVLRNSTTEPPHSSCLLHSFPKSGYFACAGCELPLYPTEAKFSDAEWPAWDRCFHSQVQGSHVKVAPGCLGEQYLLGAEILCSCCDGHLGHVFWGEGRTKANQRH